MAIQLNGNFCLGFYYRAILKQKKLGDVSGAYEDHKRAQELDQANMLQLKKSDSTSY